MLSYEFVNKARSLILLLYPQEIQKRKQILLLGFFFYRTPNLVSTQRSLTKNTSLHKTVHSLFLFRKWLPQESLISPYLPPWTPPTNCNCQLGFCYNIWIDFFNSKTLRKIHSIVDIKEWSSRRLSIICKTNLDLLSQ